MTYIVSSGALNSTHSNDMHSAARIWVRLRPLLGVVKAD